MRPIVIVGGGLAAATACTAIRDAGHEGPVIVYCAETHPPYERPPLSKSYLLGDEPFEKALVHPLDWYDQHDVDLRRGTPVTAIDLAARTVSAGDHAQPYDALILATGSRARHLRFVDELGVPTAYLRNVEDADQIRGAFGPDRRIVIIGAGWIGLEVAAAARASDTAVTIFEMAPLPLLEVLGPKVAEIFAGLHRRHGVDLRLDAEVTSDDLTDADLVVVGIGAQPNVELAEAAGLAVDNGVLVDSQLRTSDPSVWAIGDIANHDHPVLGHRIRVEHWDTALQQAKVAARNALGSGEVYDRLPYFFTDQYDLGMEYVGRGDKDDEVRIIGDPGSGAFRAYWLRDGIVSAGMHVNEWDSIDEIRSQVGHPLPASP